MAFCINFALYPTNYYFLDYYCPPQRNFRNSWRVTDVTFRFRAFVVMIRLNR
jgi:hypothetical protein